MPATQSARSDNLPGRVTQAQVEEEKRKLREHLEQQMREAEKRLFGGGGAALVDTPSELPLPRRTIPSPVLTPPSAEILPTRINVIEPPPATLELPSYKPSRAVATAPSNVVPLPTRNPVLPEARTAVGMAPLPTRNPVLPEARTAVGMAPIAPPDLPTRNTPTRVFVGERTGGMTPQEIKEAQLRQLESAGVDSKVRVTPEGVEVSPPQKISRKRAALEGLLRGLEGGGLVGGVVGATAGAIAPGRIARITREDEIARSTARVDAGMEREARAAQIESTRALSTQRRNQPAEDAAKAAAAARKERIARLITMHGRAGRYDPDNPEDASSQAIKREADLLGVTDQLVSYSKSDKIPPRVTVDDTTYERQDNGDWRPAAGLPTRRMVDVPGYGKMTPAQARIADATERERTYRHGRDETEDERHARERQEENARKRRTYESEATEWAGKEQTFRANKEAEDRAISAKEERLEALYRENPGGIFGGRSAEDIKIDIARVLKDLQGHREKSGRFQTEADQAAGKATEARRNAGLHSHGGDDRGPKRGRGAIGRSPAGDGKYHYSPAEIRAQAESAGVSYESLYNKLKANKKVVIDQ